MSFSKTSIFCLILLMAFIAAPALMAHNDAIIGNLRAHSHPTLALPAYDANLDGDVTDVGEAAVTPHNIHPKVESIKLEAITDRTHGNYVVITADNEGTPNTVGGTGTEAFPGNNQFYLIVDFNVNINTASNTLGNDDYTHALVNALTAAISSGTSTSSTEVGIGTPTVDSKDGSKFKVPITIDADSDASDTTDADEAIPNGTTDDALEKLTLRIRVNAGAVISVDKNLTDPNQTGPVSASGQDSYQSDIYEFVLVHALPESDAPTLAITNAVGADGKVTFTFTFTDASGIATTGDGAFTADDITVDGGEADTLSDPVVAGTGATKTTTYTLKITPTTMYTDVIVSVAADSVTDAAPVPNALAAAASNSDTYTAPVPDPDGVITIPANSYVVVVRDKDAVGNQGLAFPQDLDGNDVNVQEWATMPDLWNRLFDKSAPGGGGALIVTEHTGTNVRHGSVGISEIMWGIDQGYLGQGREDASQWIELHNLNGAEVKVMLSTKTGTAITSDSKLTGNLTSSATTTDVLDVVTNFFNNRPGDAAWDVLGSSGNSVSGGDFASMARILPKDKKKYENADGARYDNRDGRNKGHWSKSGTAYLRSRTTRTDVTDTIFLYKGTPGNVNSFEPAKQPHTKDPRTKVAANRIIFNEVANRSAANKAYEWIELRNVFGDKVNLKNYLISAVTAYDQDKEIYEFTGDHWVPKDGILLLVNTDPKYDRDHPLQIGAGVSYKVTSFKIDLPNDGNFVLFLRGRADNKPDGIGLKKPDHVLDIAGYTTNVNRSPYTNAVSSTSLWPLKSAAAPAGGNKLVAEQVFQRNRGAKGLDGVDNDLAGAGVHKGAHAFGKRSYTGVGYKRLTRTVDAHGGTPGYPNGALHKKGTTVMDSVYISEIMYADNDKGVLPQWIELRNTSKTVGVDLNNWRLSITNHDDKDATGADWKGKGQGSVLLRGLKIKPNSSVLITSRRAVQRIDVSTVHMPSSDIFILWNKNKGAFGMTSVNDDILNPYGFEIKLEASDNDKDFSKVDEVGNLATRRTGDAVDRNERADTERFDAPEWAWPDALSNGNRISVVRKAWSDEGTLIVSGDTKKTYGTKKWAWELSTEDAGHDRVAAFTYYGSVTDISSPGLSHGQALPVELSAFRPTLEDGKVVVRWTTESELDNAGFNIYRSETRDGEFKQVNAQLIQGAGTTGERNAYEWVDTTAKPDVVYYYQIEDVSFSGERQRLATNRLKGYVSAKNKLTTRWGELKKTLQ